MTKENTNKDFKMPYFKEIYKKWCDAEDPIEFEVWLRNEYTEAVKKASKPEYMVDCLREVWHNWCEADNIKVFEYWLRNKFTPMQSLTELWEKSKAEVAEMHGLGKNLVTGHRSKYFDEAFQLFLQQIKDTIPNFSQ